MIIQGDNLLVLPTLPEKKFHTCVTSPPYWGLQDYGLPPSEWPEITYTPMPGLDPITVPEWTGCLGLEPTPELFVAHTVHVFRLIRRVLRDDGTIWLNFGDSYAGSGKGRMADGTHSVGGKQETNAGSIVGSIGKTDAVSGLKPKDLVGIPWRIAFALQADGWYLRMDIVWNKPNAMPESVIDRPTKAHEYLFLLSKSVRYYYDHSAIMEPLASSSIARLSQDVESQKGSSRANGGAKTNGTMKAVGGSRGAFGPPQSRRRSVNKDRKFGEDRGRHGFHLGASIPREGSYRNKRSVWSVDDPLEIWNWLFRRLGDEAYILLADFLVERREKGSVWTVSTAQMKEAHFATFPEKLIEPCILAGSPVGGVVLDPFGGSGTTKKVALENNRECILIEQNPEYVEIAEKRTAVIQPNLIF